MRRNAGGRSIAVGLVLACGLLFLVIVAGFGLSRLMRAAVVATPDFGGTLRALVTASAAGSQPASTPTIGSAPGSTTGAPAGHIVLTCQVFKAIAVEQVCIMNADGSDYHRLTSDNAVRHFYPALAPDGRSVVYSQYREDGVYEIYELQISDGTTTRLTNRLGVLTAPEISPDGTKIVFTNGSAVSDKSEVWIMNRDGSQPRRLIKLNAWDPTWSPDGSRILFASDMDGTNQLYVVALDGSGLRKITNLPSLRGRSDWSVLDKIVTYSGSSWQRELFILNLDGTGVHQVGPTGGNSQGPSFSPDGNWITFTAYFDHMHEDNGCEIYAMRADGTEMRRLTNNDYCDYQPRWGP